MADRLILSLEFSDAGITVSCGQSYENGLAFERTFMVPRGSDYDDEIAAVEIACNALVDDVEEDTARMRPVDLHAQSGGGDAEGEDGIGMGWPE